MYYTLVVFVENYKIQISRSVFTHIHVHLRWVCFLTTLDIYKDYFKGRLKWCNSMQIVIRDKIFPSSSYSL